MKYITHPIVKYYVKHPFILLKNRLKIIELLLKKVNKEDSSFSKTEPISKLKIDIVIPCIEKDLKTLPFVVDSIRLNIKHPINNIFIISPNSIKIKKICIKKKCKYIFEENLVSIKKNDIHYTVEGTDRSGWMYQQILKWSADKITNIGKYFLITDADTVYCRPQVFEFKKRIILTASNQLCHIPYFDAIYKLTGELIKPVYNYTSHHSLFEKEKLHNIKKIIEKHTGKLWYEAIIGLANPKEGSCVSDYETYGQIVEKLFPNHYVVEHWLNISLSYRKRNEIKDLIEQYSKSYKTISFHTYKL